MTVDNQAESGPEGLSSTGAAMALEHMDMEAALRFLIARRNYLGELDENGQSQVAGVEVVGVGIDAIRRSLKQRWASELLSVGVNTTAERLDNSYANDRRLVEAGTKMVSLYDHRSTDAGGLTELQRRRDWHVAHFCASPVQLKVYDRRLVIMDGPMFHGECTALAVTDRRMVAEALHYFSTLRRNSRPIETDPPPEPSPNFTPRQHQVIRLLYQGLPDAEIAERIGVSLRTVHYEIAEINRTLGVSSRFAAGARLIELGLIAGAKPAPSFRGAHS